MHIFPQLRKLEKKYASELMVVGVHSAKFPNEKEKSNLYKAVQRYELEHAVINDVDFQVWQQYACRAWPTLMFIDPEGKVIGKFEGELGYDEFDNLLGRMVSEFDGKGLINRTPVLFASERETGGTLSFPGKVLADGESGRLFIADSNHNRIIVSSLEGEVQQVIGNGEEGLADGDFASAALNHPQGMALVGDSLYIADTENHAIRRADLSSQQIETIAGTGEQGHAREGRAPGPRMSLNSPFDLIIEGDTIYIAMAGCHQLWSMTISDGMVGPHAGSGRESLSDGPMGSATLAQPCGITTDGTKLYFADSETSSIRMADLHSGGRVQTVVGLDLFIFGDRDGVEHHVRLQHPIGITHLDGTLYITDTYNHKIKRILPATRSSFTLLGTGEAGRQDGPGGTQAQFSEPSGLSITNGKMYIADTNNHVIRVADMDTSEVSTLELTGI
jgi:DNA-binding beta-propeller fold protein YncE